MKIKVSYFRAKDKATGKRMAILVNEAGYMFVLYPWCIASHNDYYHRHAARSAVGMKGWQPRDMENYCEWKLVAKYTVDYKGVF
ncbi:TPA: hypothetical protein O7N39_002207 [Escherichia coli]|jgi:hypothetical protein|nr:hypothetical protein [Escherichia coli]HDY2085839.1 hypothetical protein [Escherichia coli]